MSRRLIPLIQSIEGVALAQLSGGSHLECRIVLDDNKLRNLKLNKIDILSQLNSFYRKKNIGVFRKKQENINIILSDHSFKLEEIKAFPIFIGEKELRLDQLAKINVQFSPVQRLARFNAFPSITLSIYRKATSNSLALITKIKEKMNVFHLKAEQHFQLIQDQSIHIKNEFRSIGKRALWSSLAILLVLLIFSRNYREPLILFFSIFITTAMSLIGFYIFNLSINFLTLAGLALSFGIVVDNSIVLFEQFKEKDGRRISEKRNRLVLPLLASTLTSIIVLIPFIFLSESLRLLYIPFAKALTFSLLSSLFISFVLVPPIYERWIKKSFIQKTQDKRHSKNHLTNFFKPYIHASLSYPKFLLFLFVWIIGFPVYLIENDTWEDLFLLKYKTEINYILGGTTGLFINHVYKGEAWNWGDETYVGIFLRMPFGSSIDETNRIVKLIEKNLLTDHHTDIRIIAEFGHLRANLRIYFDNPDSGTPFIVKSKAIILASNIGGATLSVYGYGPGFSNGGAMSMATFRLSLKGYNYDRLKTFGNRISKDLKTNRRIANVAFKSNAWSTRKERYYNVQFLDDKIQELGLSRSFIAQQINLWLSKSYPDMRLQYQNEDLDIRLSFAKNKTDIRDLLRGSIFKNKKQIPISNLIRIEEKETTDQIMRENQEYKAVLSFDYRGPFRYGEKYVKQFLENVKTPIGFSVEAYKFQYSSKDEKSSNFVLILSAFLIFLLCAALFESFRLGFLILLAIPASLTGIFSIYFISDYSFTLAARIGVVLICGLTVNNAILLTSEIKSKLEDLFLFNERKNSFELKNIAETNKQLQSAITLATLNRLRPILMTTLTTIIGLIPLLFTDTISGEDLWSTLSLTIIGGLSSSMILILFIFPAINYLFLKSYYLDYIKKFKAIYAVKKLEMV